MSDESGVRAIRSAAADREALRPRRVGADPWTVPKIAWLALTVVSTFNAVSAVGGAIAIFLTDGLGMPKSILSGSPFDSFLVPGLILLVIVGGTQSATAVLLVMRRRSSLAWAAFGGLTMMTWILIETAIIRGFGALQALYYLTGAAQLVLVLTLLGAVGVMPRSRLAVPSEPAPPVLNEPIEVHHAAI